MTFGVFPAWCEHVSSRAVVSVTIRKLVAASLGIKPVYFARICLELPSEWAFKAKAFLDSFATCPLVITFAGLHLGFLLRSFLALELIAVSFFVTTGLFAAPLNGLVACFPPIPVGTLKGVAGLDLVAAGLEVRTVC